MLTKNIPTPTNTQPQRKKEILHKKILSINKREKKAQKISISFLCTTKTKKNTNKAKNFQSSILL